jgi:hypothetical protein
MSRSGRLLSALTMSLTFGAACTPSGSATRAPRAGADSATEATPEPTPESEIAGTGGDVITEPTPDVVAAPRAPRAPVAVRPIPVPRPAGPYGIRVVDESHHDLPTFANGGRTYVMGTVGARYSIVVTNPTPRRVEAVVSVDGLDAIDGHAANYVAKRGYILPAYGDTTIDGFRTSLEDVATFRFSSVADSYAGRLGQARDVGVIGVAFFPERPPPTVWRQPPSPPIYPPRSRAAPSPAAPPSDDLARDSAPAAGAGGRASSSAQASPPASESKGAASAPSRRPGLGTEFGEARESHIETTEFVRASASQPSQVSSLRYNNRAGLIALGIVIPEPYVAAETDLHLRETADPFRANRFAQPPP